MDIQTAHHLFHLQASHQYCSKIKREQLSLIWLSSKLYREPQLMWKHYGTMAVLVRPVFLLGLLNNHLTVVIYKFETCYLNASLIQMYMKTALQTCISFCLAADTCMATSFRKSTQRNLSINRIYVKTSISIRKCTQHVQKKFHKDWNCQHLRYESFNQFRSQATKLVFIRQRKYCLGLRLISII